MKRVILIGLFLGGWFMDGAVAQGPVNVRTYQLGPLVTTELQPILPAPAPRVPPVAGAFRPDSAKLSTLKWQTAAWFEDAQGRRWRRVAGLPTLPLPVEMSGWILMLNDGREYFYTSTGQLFAVCLPVQGLPAQGG